MDQALTDRGLPLAELRSGKINGANFASQEVPLTVREHINALAAEGKTKDEIEFDMAERGFYDAERNIKENSNSLLPDKLESTRHREIMDGNKILGLIEWDQPWKEAKASGRFTAHDPYKIPELAKAQERLLGIKAGFESSEQDEVMAYLDYIKKRDAWAGRASTGEPVFKDPPPEPDVSSEAKEKASEISTLKKDLARAKTGGFWTGVGTSAYETVDMLWGKVGDTRILPRAYEKEDETQTKYFRVPVVGPDGKILPKKNPETGAPIPGTKQFRLVESPEELLKLNQEGFFKDARESANKLNEMRTKNLGIPEKMREEVIDVVVGFSDIMGMMLPYLNNANAAAYSAYEKLKSDPSFKLDELKQQEAISGFQGGAGLSPALVSWFAPYVNSGIINMGMGNRLTPEESERGDGFWAPFTKELETQGRAMPLDTFFMMYPVMKMLKGMGSLAAAAKLAKADKALAKMGLPPEDVARLQATNLEKHLSAQQKSYLRRMMESSLGNKLDKKALNLMGEAADVATKVAKTAAVAVALGDPAGALGEAAAISGMVGLGATAQVAVRTVPALRKAFGGEIYASKNPYVESAAREFSDQFAEMQNIIDSDNSRRSFQAGRGEFGADAADPSMLGAMLEDNVARIQAAVEVDPAIVSMTETLAKMDKESPEFAASQEAVRQAVRNRFIELAEESGMVYRGDKFYTDLRDINREKGSVKRDYDNQEAEFIAKSQEEIRPVLDEAEARLADQTPVDTSPARLEEIELREAELKVDYDLEVAAARTDYDNAVSDLNLGSKQRVQKAEQRLGKAKEEYAASRRKADEADQKIVATGKRKLDSVLSSKSKNRELRQRRIKKVRDDVAAKRQRNRNRYAKTQDRMKANIQRLTDAKKAADQNIKPKTSVLQATLDIQRRYNKRVAKLQKVNDRGLFSLGKERLKIEQAREAAASKLASQMSDIENGRLYSSGAISLDELLELRSANTDSALRKQTSAIQKEVNRIRGARDRRLERLSTNEQDILNMLKEEYKNRIYFEDGIPRSDNLFKQKTYHVTLDDSGLDTGRFISVAEDAVEGAQRQGVDIVTYSDPPSQAANFAKRMEKLPLAQQQDIIQGIKKATEALVEGVRGFGKSITAPGKNTAYQFIYESLSSLIFDEFSPKLLKSGTLRAQFSTYVSKQISDLYGVPNSTAFQASIDKLINNFASPRAVAGNIYADIGYTFYTRSGTAAFDLKSMFVDFARTKVSKKQMKRMAVEAVQSELPNLQQRVGIASATDILLRRSGTNYDDFTKGVYHSGKVNWPYIQSIVKTFQKEGSMPVAFRVGNSTTVDVGGSLMNVKELEKALFYSDRTQEIRAMLGPDGYDQFRQTVADNISTLDAKNPRQYKYINADNQWNRLDDFKVIGEGAVPDQLMGIKTQHPAITADRVTSSVGAFKPEASAARGNDIVVHKDFSSTMGWLLRTNDVYQRSGFLMNARILVALFKLGKTALNPGNWVTNAISNHTTLMAANGLDPYTASRIIVQSAKDQLLYRYSPDQLSPEAKAQINALIETGGINQTVLVQEVDNILQQMDGSNAFVDAISAMATGRYPDGSIPFSKTDGTKGKVARKAFELNANMIDSMKNGYRIFGDEMYKLAKARLDMIENAKQFEDMARGSGMSLYDKSKGQYGRRELIGHVHKGSDGNFYVVNKHGKVEKGPAAVLKINAEAAMGSANSLFYNLGDLGTAFRTLITYEGLGPSPFLSWRLHSLDIPGLKKGLFYNSLMGDEYRYATDPAIAGRLALEDFNKSIRRSALALALKDRSVESSDIREALPSYMQNAFIRSDLKMLLADNQIPWSGMLGYLTAIPTLARLSDPKRSAEGLFWDKVFPEKNEKAAMADLFNPMIVDTANLLLNATDPRTGNKIPGGRFSAEWFDNVARTLGDGRVLVARRVIQTYFDQESAATLDEISGQSDDMLLKRRLLDHQSKGMSLLTALLMRRYQYINPGKMARVVAAAPKSILKSFHSKMKREYQVDWNNKNLPRAPYEYFIGLNMNESNARKFAEQYEEFEQLFGSDAVISGGKKKVKGVFVPMAMRLFENIKSGLETQEAKDRFQAEVDKTTESFIPDDSIAKEYDKIMGVSP